VDDGSTDDSAAIADSYGPPVRVIRQANQGESVAMNAGIAAATSTHIVFLGADDVLSPDLLEAQLRAIDGAPDAVACTGFAFFLDDVKNAFNATLPKARAFLPDIISANIAPASCWMTPRHVLIQAGCYHTSQQYFEDWDLWWRVALTGAPYVPVPMVGFYYRQHIRSQLATLAAAERAYGHAWLMERMCREFLDRGDLLAEHGETLFWAAMSAVRASRSHGVAWERLELLTNVIEALVRRHPAALARSRSARMVRRAGVRRAETLRVLFTGKDQAPSYRAPWLTDAMRPVAVAQPTP
jgi:glycosyltransferase involved in cell wall biosynthesis